MRLLVYISILAVLNSLISCQKKPVEYIIPTDPEGIFAEVMKDGLTVDEASATSLLMMDSVYRNTINRKIPQIIVRDLQHKTLNLQDVIKDKSVIISGDIYCWAGKECLLDTIPEAARTFQHKGSTLPIICLAIKTAQDYEDSTRFNHFLKELTLNYNRVLIVDEQEASKINALNGATRYYVTAEQVVSDVAFGNCTTGNLHTEMKQLANRK